MRIPRLLSARAVRNVRDGRVVLLNDPTSNGRTPPTAHARRSGERDEGKTPAAMLRRDAGRQACGTGRGGIPASAGARDAGRDQCSPPVRSPAFEVGSREQGSTARQPRAAGMALRPRGGAVGRAELDPSGPIPFRRLPPESKARSIAADRDPGTGTLQRFSAGNPGKAGQHQQCPPRIPTGERGFGRWRPDRSLPCNNGPTTGERRPR